MSDCAACGTPVPTVVVRGVDTAVLVQLLQQQRREGQAAMQLVAAAAVASASGAPEPGKGGLVDVVA
ncbi:MAG: hypothetical protein JNM25_00925 [Planctomycetes bacterium]|nr:hypothetical protein [Planctomycetota bacterium]